MKIDARGICCSYGEKQVLYDINVSTRPGVTGLLGPNASGKSTFLKCLAGIMDFRGSITYGDVDIGEYTFDRLVTEVGYMPQDAPCRAVLTVFEAILLGRLHSLTLRENEDDIKKVCAVMDGLGIAHLSSKCLNELSGGQKQMVSVAQVLVREPNYILMDEPTNNLDLRHQFEMFDVIRDISKRQGINILVALHDLNLAARYCDKIVMLDAGRVSSQGSPVDVLTPESIRDIYGVNVRVYEDDGRICVVPIDSVSR